MTTPISIARYLVLMLASMPILALAEHATRPDPADPASPVPSAQYESAFTGYQSFQDEKSTPWKEVNAAVTDMTEAAGHAGHGVTTTAKTPPIAPAVAAAAVVAVADTAAPVTPSKPVTAKTETLAATGVITATGVVQQVDKGNAKVKLSHDPIPALGWPKMTMFLRLKDGALADQVKAGDTVEFQLEKSGSGYVISNFAKPTSAPAPATGK